VRSDAAVMSGSVARSRDFVALAKPRLNVLVVASTLVGYAMADGDALGFLRVGGLLLGTGLVAGGAEIAQHPAVVDVPVGRGHVVLFSNNPLWRGETQGSYFLVFNAILNFDHLNSGRTLDPK